jgi:hypothetical protein
MRAKLSTVALVVVVGGVVLAAAIDSLKGHPASSSQATDAVPAHTANGPPAVPVVSGPVRTIVFGRQVERGHVVPGLLVAAPGEPGRQVVAV